MGCYIVYGLAGILTLLGGLLAPEPIRLFVVVTPLFAYVGYLSGKSCFDRRVLEQRLALLEDELAQRGPKQER